MNCGFSNLETLKGFVLPEGQRATTTYDVRLQVLGKGIAAELEKWCSRSFGRVVGDQFVVGSDRGYIALPRFPLESVSLIELQTDLSTGYTVLPANTLLNMDQAAGLIEFGTPIGPFDAKLRITYTGGYWWETLESTEDGYPTTPPVGSAALPADLQLAWLLGCQRVFERARTMSLTGIKDVTRAGVQLLNIDEELRSMIAPFIRFA